MPPSKVEMPLMEVENLSVSYTTASGTIHAVRDFSLELAAGESCALVGETGSGKSTVALALVGLLGTNGRVASGEIRLDAVPLANAGRETWKQVRGKKIGTIFQDSRGALNPVLTIGSQVIEAVRAHQRLDKKAARAAVCALLSEAGVPDPLFFMERYASELSGGMCQRIAIAIALCNRPKLLIADEPTSALDPSIQAQILQLLQETKQRRNLALLLISHDLALVSQAAERVAVMYHGRLVEVGPAGEVFKRPAHPYTAALIECQADLHHHWKDRPLAAIPGAPPPGAQNFPGCSFAPRCVIAEPACSARVPPAAAVAGNHWAACIKPRM